MRKKIFTTFVGEGDDRKEIKLSVVKPTLAQDNESIRVYTRTKIQLLNLPKDQRPFAQSGVRIKLQEVGVWSDEQEKQLQDLIKRIGELEDILRSGKRVEDGLEVKLNKKEGYEFAIELMLSRLGQFNLLNEVEQFARDITLEKIAEREQLDYLVSVCTLDENNKKYFKDVDDYKSRQYDEDATDARINLKNHLDEIVEDWRADLMEYKFFIKYGFMNDKYQFINEAGKLVDLEGNLVNEDGLRIDENDNIIEVTPSEVGEFSD